MKRTLANLFSIQPGEGVKTFLLFAMHLVFYVGLRWGDNAGYSLFIQEWGGEQLPLTQAGNALLAVVIGMAYSAVAGRISNQRMLLILSSVMIAWLASVRLLLAVPATSGPNGLVYPYFYIAARALSDLSALHILSYISDFYDTRAAKRALPLLLSATIVGGIVANFSADALESSIQLVNMPLAWGVCLLVVISLALIVQRRLPAEEALADRAPRRSKTATSARASLRANLRLVLESGILRWLAVSTFLLVVLMGLLNMQAGVILDTHFQGNSQEIFRFTNLFDGIFNIAGALFSLLVFSRLLARLGVGTMNLVFPLITLLAIGAMYLPGLTGSVALGAAVLGRADDRTIKKVFRNSIDPMLFNSVTQHVKARTRSFINSSMVPLGTLASALLQPALQASAGTLPLLGLSVGLGIGALYVVSAVFTRVAYRRALVKLLAEDEMALFRASRDDYEQADPNTLRLLEERLRASANDDITVFLAETLCDFKGREAIGPLQELAAQRGPFVRAGILRTLGGLISEPAVRQMCLDGLRDADARVREAAAIALAGAPTSTRDNEVLDAFVAALGTLDEATQAAVIPPLIASGEFYYLMPAAHTLYSWLSDKESGRRRAFGLRVLSHTGDARLVRRLATFLDDPEPSVRTQAAELIASLAAGTPLADMKQLGLEALHRLLGDTEPAVRLAAVDGLGRFNSLGASLVLMMAMHDADIEVRRRACAVIQVIPRDELERLLRSGERRVAECAAFVLARSRHLRGKRLALDFCETLTSEAYALLIDGLPLQQLGTPGARLMQTAFRERAYRLVDQVFWLVSALGNEQAVESIRRSLRSGTSATRANAVETLESITTPQLAQVIDPLFDGSELPMLARIGRDRLGLPGSSAWEVCRQAWPQAQGDGAAIEASSDRAPPARDAWLAAMSMYTLAEVIGRGRPAEAALLGGDAVVLADRIRPALYTVQEAGVPLLQETARLALSHLEAPERPATQERSMLTLIEKVIFLKEVPFFQGMSVDDLRRVANISEVATYDAGQQIIAEGERSGTLYVIVSGRVGIQHRKQDTTEATMTMLASLGPREYFAEMSIFDDEPHSADVIALTPTQVLMVRRAPLIALIQRQPELALGLFSVLSQRLRQANAQLAKRRQA